MNRSPVGTRSAAWRAPRRLPYLRWAMPFVVILALAIPDRRGGLPLPVAGLIDARGHLVTTIQRIPTRRPHLVELRGGTGGRPKAMTDPTKLALTQVRDAERRFV